MERTKTRRQRISREGIECRLFLWTLVTPVLTTNRAPHLTAKSWLITEVIGFSIYAVHLPAPPLAPSVIFTSEASNYLKVVNY